jgi:hypothetical protein
MNIINDAIDQEYYIKRKFDTNTTLMSDEIGFIEKDYVVKIAGRLGQISRNTMISRLNRIKNDFGLHYLSTTNFWVSGMINYAKELKEKRGMIELTKEEYEMINIRFGKKGNWFDTKRLIKDFVDGS